MLFNIKRCLNQRGFTLIELVTVMAIISILAVIAIGKYSDATATANTAKIASDLSTIDSAIAMYQAEGHSLVGVKVEDLVSEGHLIVEPKAPSGYYFIDGKKSDIALDKNNSYQIDENSGRSYLNDTNNTSEQFHY